MIAYNTSDGSNILYPRTLYTLYVGPNNNGIGHLIFKLSMKQILTTIKYQPVPIHECLFETINETNSFTTKIPINQFDSDYFQLKMIISMIPKMKVKLEGQTQRYNVDNTKIRVTMN